MSRKILIIGLPTENPKVKHVRYAEDAPSLFDFEIVIADIDSVLPFWCQEKCPVDEYLETEEGKFASTRKSIEKLKKEMSFLLENGGILVCIMRPKRGLSFRYWNPTMRHTSDFINNYDWIPIKNLEYNVAYGSGKGIKVCDTTNKFSGYLQMNETFWTAYFERVDGLGIKSQIVGVNDANQPIAVEFYIGKGVIIFQPPSSHPNLVDILLGCAVNFLEKGEELPPPSWIKDVTVPNEKDDLEKFASLENEVSEVKNRYDILGEKIREETSIKKILYEKNVALENIVKESFEELGFVCKKKDDKDWMIDSDFGKGILEITGSEGSIDVTKFRQLLNYVLDESKTVGDDRKGILVANHFSDLPVEERGEPFTEKALSGSKLHSICLIPTSELFKLICYLRLGKITAEDAQKRILGTVGVFSA